DRFLVGLGVLIGLVLAERELRERRADERPLVREVAVRDQVLLRMRREPALAVRDELLDLGVADEVVLVVVQYGEEHVEEREAGVDGLLARDLEREDAGAAPRGEVRIEGVRLDSNLVAERTEEALDERRAPADANGGHARTKGERLPDELRPILALAAER